MFLRNHAILLSLVVMIMNVTSNFLKNSFSSDCDPSDPETQTKINNYIQEHQKNLSESDIKLIKFIAGECLPVIYLPGLYAIKLQFLITNCTELKQNHPLLSSSCNYDTNCKDGFEKLFWLTENFEKEDNTTCLAQIIKLNYTYDEEKKTFIEQKPKGFKLTFYGNTPKTKDKNECGFGASSFLLDKMFYFGNVSPRGLYDCQEFFLKMGYQTGLNLFSVPFDWRIHSNDEYNLKMIKDTIDLSYEINKKPAIIIGHSLGSLNGLSFLYNMDDNFKEQKVARFIAVGPPFMGVAKSIKGKVLGMEEFNIKVSLILFDIINLYVSMENQKIFDQQLTLSYDFLPKFTWENSQNELWFKLFIQRGKVENDITDCVKFMMLRSKDTEFLKFNDQMIEDYCIEPILEKNKETLKEFSDTFPFFPDLIEGCHDRKRSSATCYGKECNSIWDSYCRLNIYNLLDNFFLKIQDEGIEKEFKIKDSQTYVDLIKQYGISEYDEKFMKFVFDSLNQKFNTLDHPNVPVTIVYNSGFKTAVAYKLPVNPTRITENNEFVLTKLGYDIEVHNGGDGTVESASAIMPGFKWSYLFSNKKPEGKEKPVHFANYCSNKNFNPDNPSINKEMDLNKNMFFNVDCRCQSPEKEPCKHSAIISDENVLNFIKSYSKNKANLIKDNDELNSAFDLVNRKINNSQEKACSNLKNY
jgi:hypothetical protein